MVNFTDYELIDFGQGRKLERFGSEILDRPESMAQNAKILKPGIWKQVGHTFKETNSNKGKWTPNNELEWFCELDAHDRKLKIHLHKGQYKHVGVFPEQLAHWQFIEKELRAGHKMLNLFAYTGASSLVGAAAGASVTHIDSSKSIMKMARQNAEINKISSIRFIQEDAQKFSERELKRKSFYDLVICDPPVFGMGLKREKWKLEKDLPGLISTLSKIIHPNGLLILNTYSPRVSISDMKELLGRSRFSTEDSGWLEIQSSLGNSLMLSKYIIGRRSASA